MTFIIAEVGSNFKTLEDCLISIESAKKAGADACKFQMFSKKDLFGPKYCDKPSIGSIDPNWLEILKEKCIRMAIELMVTGFSPEGYDKINKFVMRHKIASCENNDKKILEAVGKTGKQIILSCGSSNALKIEESVSYLDKRDVVLLYCVASYPATITRLEKIRALKHLFPTHTVGFSDHSTDFAAIPVAACREYGAEYLEKHFNPLNLTDTPDAPHSINYEQFKMMVERIRSLEKVYNIEPEELEVARKAKRRVVALKDIQSGEKLNVSNVGVFRPTIQSDMIINPFQLESVLGKKAIKNFKCGEAIQV